MKKIIDPISRRILLLLLPVTLFSWAPDSKPSRAFYQVTVYHFNNSEQEKMLDNYLQNALLPALHRMNIVNVGVFKAIANDTAVSKSQYVLISLKSLELVTKISEKLAADKIYQAAGTEYMNAVYSSPPYTRIETILLQAFPLAPQIQIPQLTSEKKNRVYELRSYESPTENKAISKERMFNEGGEIEIFKKLNFNPIFYGEVITGSKMPNLMYMTSYENMADRDAHWKNFSSDSAWKRLSSMPEYQHNVSHIDDIFLYPADYSDL